MRKLILLSLLFVGLISQAQITTVGNMAIMPRVNVKTSITNPLPGMLIYEISTQKMFFRTLTGWVDMSGGGGAAVNMANSNLIMNATHTVDMNGKSWNISGGGNGYVGLDMNNALGDISIGANHQILLYKGFTQFLVYDDIEIYTGVGHSIIIDRIDSQTDTTYNKPLMRNTVNGRATVGFYPIVNDPSKTRNADTAGMLTNYRHWTIGYIKPTDTSGMLTNYRHWTQGYLKAADIANKLDKNTAITAATKTKITYDINGLVTAGTDITGADVGLSGGTTGQVLKKNSNTSLDYSWVTSGGSSVAFVDITGVAADNSSLNSALVAKLSVSALTNNYLEAAQTITAGSATTVTTGNVVVYINPASVLGTHTITMPASPQDKQRIGFYYGGTIAAGAPVVTTLAVAANAGQSLLQEITPQTANSGDYMEYSYQISITTWRRIK